MKKGSFIPSIVKCMMAICFTFTMLCTGMVASVHAAEYEIVFKAGAHGTIAGEKSVAYRKAYGEVFPDEPVVSAESGYAFDGWNKELPEVGSSVTGKEVYVARYITLVDGVEYRVRYVDELGVDIATQKVSVTENGKVIQERAKVLAGYSYDQAVKTLQINTQNREIVFVYTLTDAQAAATNPPVVTTIQTGTTTPAVNPTPNTTTPDNTAPDNTTTPDNDPEEEVNDDQTPQGGGEEEVDDNKTPLANLTNDSMGWMIGIGGAALVGAVLVFVAYKKRKQHV